MGTGGGSKEQESGFSIFQGSVFQGSVLNCHSRVKEKNINIISLIPHSFLHYISIEKWINREEHGATLSET